MTGLKLEKFKFHHIKKLSNMTTFYTILGAIIFWLCASIALITILFIAGEHIWRKVYYQGYLTFLDFIINHKDYKEWRAKRDAREKALKAAKIKITSNKKWYE
jgi:hypothetical protein